MFYLLLKLNCLHYICSPAYSPTKPRMSWSSGWGQEISFTTRSQVTNAEHQNSTKNRLVITVVTCVISWIAFFLNIAVPVCKTHLYHYTICIYCVKQIISMFLALHKVYIWFRYMSLCCMYVATSNKYVAPWRVFILKYLEYFRGYACVFCKFFYKCLK